MFGNLIESRSHASEFARRGYFIVGTTLCYASLLIAGAVASVYAYDAHLETQDLERVSLVTPLTPAEPTPEHQARTQATQRETSQVPERAQAIARLDTSTKVPSQVSTAPSNLVEVPNGVYEVTGRDIDPPGGAIGPVGPSNGNSGNGTAPAQPLVVDTDTPPVLPPVVKKVVTISKGPVTGEAISLPKPVYPRAAIDLHVSGAVKVQVLIDETGKVVSAQVMDGSPFLRAAALQVAWQARFKPTTLGGEPVKVSGFIVYNFSQNQ